MALTIAADSSVIDSSSVNHMSSATITAIAVLESPRTVPDKPKSFIFDGQLWLDSERPLVAAFRYFNSDDIKFDAGPTCCMIVAHIAKYSDKFFPLLYLSLDKEDYDIIGDIVYLIPLPEETDPRHLPYIHVADGCELDVPVTGYFPDSPRYKNDKPVPRERTITAFEGWLTGTTGRAAHQAPETFRAQVDSVAFLGRSTTAALAAPQVPHGKDDVPKKLQYDYSKFTVPKAGSSSSPAPGASPSKGLAEPELKKRKLRSSDNVANVSRISHATDSEDM